MAGQLLVRAALDDLPILDHQYQVGLAYRGQPMGDHERGPVLDHLGQRALDVVFRANVNAGGRVVEDEDGRVQEQRASYGQALALSPRQGDASLADRRAVALRQTYYEIVKLGYLGGADHIGVGCVIDAVLDVVANRGAEDEHVLQDDPDVPAKRRQRGLAGIRPIDQHTSRGDIVEPGDKVHQGALARSGRPEDGDELSGLDLEADVADRGRP